MSEPKTSIPRFVSFRPAPEPPGSTGVTKVKEKSQKSQRRDGRTIVEDGKHHCKRHRSRTRGREITHSTTLRKTKSPAPGNDGPLESFIVDQKGDLNNLVYGSNHRYSIPLFQRAGAGRVMGAPSDIKIDRDYGDDKGIVLSHRTHFKSNFREKYVFSKIERDRPRILKIRPGPDVGSLVETELDFLSLQKPQRKKRKRANAEETSESDQDTIDYRSIRGKAKASDQLVEEDLQYATESESSASETGRVMKLDQRSRQRTAELSQIVEKHPHDIDAWISLIDHQDTLINSVNDRRRITNAEIRSTADIKIHMYEKALDKARTLSDRERLHLGLMSEGAKVWGINYQSDRWEQIAKDNIDSLLLWKSYVSFKQTTFSTFRYEEVKEVFVKRIKLLRAALSAVEAGGENALYQQLLYVLLRLTLYIRESGFAELAVATWQGLLEFNFFAPSQIDSPSQKFALFMAFWESEVPRIGEIGALGWCRFAENEDSSLPPEPASDEAANLRDKRHLFASWAKSEQCQAKASRVPARTMDEVTENDPFRVVLTSDIEEYLISLPSDSKTLRRSMLDSFLLFCRLSQIAGPKEIPSYDMFISGGLLERLPSQTWQFGDVQAWNADNGAETNIKSVFETPVSNFASSSETMFAGTWFNGLESWTACYGGDNGPVPYQWIRTALQQLTHSHFSDDFGEYYLAFEWRNGPETIKKVSKALLKQHPSSLRLYNAYAMIEQSRGNKEAASGVFSAALNMSRSMAEGDRKHAIYLWKSWIWAALEDADNNTALRRILAIVDGDPEISVAATTLLKAKQHLLSNRDYSLSSGDASVAVVYAECVALFEYLSSTSATEAQSNHQGDINSALASYSKFSQMLRVRRLASSTSHELFLQSATRLLYHHARIGPFRPALLRDHLTNFLMLFPQNTIFLSLYAFNESRLRIDNRVRSMLLSTALTFQNDTLTSRLFAIHFEIKHGTIHSVRSAFESALSTRVASSSAGLWKFYILYCLQTPQFYPHIKDVWYRGLRACPWAKELYVLGFERLERFVEFEELKGTWRVMGEKELRVHIHLEDLFEEIGEMGDRDNSREKIMGLGLN